MNREHYWYNYPINSREPFRQPAQPGVGVHIPHNLTGEQLQQMFACSPPSGTKISCKYYFLKKKGFTGKPITLELPTSDGVGRFRHYRNDGGVWSIHWHPDTDAHEVHGAIRDKWASLGWEHFGYPITDEYMSGHGRFNLFRAVHLPDKPESSIYWTPQFGAHAISGPIRGKYGQKGWHTGSLGFPISDEQDRPGGGRIQRFEHGSIIWTPGTGAFVEGETLPPVHEPPVQPKPIINVSRQNSNIVVTGSNFKSNASIRIRIVVAVAGNEFSYYANSNESGGFTHPIDISGLPQGIDIYVSATDGTRVPPSQDITGFLWSNTVPIRL
ncbi:hypothetical protein COF68_17645 [Bacillus toyonensis]|uniref:LGFP repeat-containing protein n=1 Tax=Bacillus toyonensis TaxID=155322 RepID=UPI000BED6995|nr:hypothetical protein [Bacillus toyonensis]PEB22129.1 hypothetical protein COO05_23445 [Bacillus toyonensis]PHE61124.1 hypothetical protein COF68_17645 [Bacillus toyonensis]